MPEGRAVLLTRPLEESRETAGILEAEGIDSLVWPLTRIVPTGAEVALPPGTDALLVTSAHGIRAFAALSPRRDLPVLTVGGRTAEVARRLGFAGVISADGDAEALAALARGTAYRRFLYPRGREVSADLAARVGGGGRVVNEAVLYAAEETGPPPAPVAHALASGRVGVATLWSRRGAAILARRLTGGLAATPARMAAVVISAQAAEPLAGAGFGAVEIAPARDSAGMLAAIRQAAAWLAP